MRTYKLIAIAFGILALSMVLGSTNQVNSANAVSARAISTVSKTVQTAHNYANNMDQTWTISQSGASKIRLRLYVDTESGYDYLYLMTGSGSVVTTYIGKTGWHWTEWVTGSSVKLRFTSDGSVTKYGFRTYKYEWDNAGSTPPPTTTDGGALTNGVAATGHMDATDGSDMWYISVGSYAESMSVVMTCGSADFDTYGKAGSQPTTSSYDWRGYTSGGEENTVSSPASGTHYIMVDHYSGDADYQLTATITYGAAPDTTAPSVSISNPSNGATVSGTVTISFTSSDANGISSRAIKIDGSTVSTGSSFSWDTTGVSNGAHTIRCEATDPSSNTGSDTHTVTVDNYVPPAGNVLQDGVTSSGSMSSSGEEQMWTISVPSGQASMEAVLTCGSADFDLYGRLGAEPTTSTYDWRGYTGGGEEVTTSNPGAGTWYIMVKVYSGTGPYQLTVTLSEPVSSSWSSTGTKYAILVGISDYAYINDLSYCDEDVVDMYNYLSPKGYEIHVWGDNHPNNFPSAYLGLATEGNVRADVQALASVATSGDEVIYWSSGHGGATGTYDGAYQSSGSNYGGNNPGTGYSYELMYNFQSTSQEFNANDESYSAGEMRQDMNGFASGVNFMVGIDRCQSGGFIYEMQQSGSHYAAGDMLVITTCGVNGYGYDQSAMSNGKFTYWIMEGLTTGGQTSFEGAFNWMNVSGKYLPASHVADNPQIGDGFSGSFVA